MPYIGKNPVGGGFHKLDSLTASATATYALTLGSAAYFPETANQLLVSLNGVIQAPQDSFTVSGSNIVFDSALTASDSIDFVVALGDVLAVKTVTDGAITTAKLGSGAVTNAKIDTMAASKLTGTIADARMPTGTVLQVVQGETTALTTFQTVSWTDTGLSATIIPKFSNSKILVNVIINWGMAELGRNFSSRLLRDSTPVGNGTGSANRQAFGHTEMSVVGFQYLIIPHTVNFLDSPATTSAITYKTQVIQNATGANIYLNRSHDNTAAQANTRSTITLTEIAG